MGHFGSGCDRLWRKCIGHRLVPPNEFSRSNFARHSARLRLNRFGYLSRDACYTF